MVKRIKYVELGFCRPLFAWIRCVVRRWTCDCRSRVQFQPLRFRVRPHGQVVRTQSYATKQYDLVYQRKQGSEQAHRATYARVCDGTAASAGVWLRNRRDQRRPMSRMAREGVSRYLPLPIRKS